MERSIEARLIENGGRTTGFDYLRIGLSTMIVVWHTCVVCYGSAAQTALATGPTRPLWALILPMFFALSGFLVAGSLERSKTLISFIGLRLIRLGPALIVESLLSIVVLGLAFTVIPKSQYLQEPGTWSYLRNVAGGFGGGIQYTLPGVFTANPNGSVNAQLWTLPWELWSYISISAIAVGVAITRAIRPGHAKLVLLLGAIVVQAFGTWHAIFRPMPDEGLLNSWTLVTCFLWGVVIYRFREQIPLRVSWMIASLVLACVFLDFRWLASLAPLPAAYLTVWLGVRRPVLVWPLTTGDYSYPVFLYGFPIQQAVAALFPWSRHAWINFVLAIVPIYLIALFSWHWVEKPVSAHLRPALFKAEPWLAARLPGWLRSLITVKMDDPAPGLKTRWSGSPADQEKDTAQPSNVP